jgi:DNA-directed RNA polymerase specialized sigma subunit
MRNNTDTHLAASIDRKSVATARYDDAMFFLNWFQPSWDALQDIERHILTCFYLSENRKAGITRELSKELKYSESWIERKRAKALRTLKQNLMEVER